MLYRYFSPHHFGMATEDIAAHHLLTDMVLTWLHSGKPSLQPTLLLTWLQRDTTTLCPILCPWCQGQAWPLLLLLTVTENNNVYCSQAFVLGKKCFLVHPWVLRLFAYIQHNCCTNAFFTCLSKSVWRS